MFHFFKYFSSFFKFILFDNSTYGQLFPVLFYSTVSKQKKNLTNPTKNPNRDPLINEM